MTTQPGFQSVLVLLLIRQHLYIVLRKRVEYLDRKWHDLAYAGDICQKRTVGGRSFLHFLSISHMITVGTIMNQYEYRYSAFQSFRKFQRCPCKDIAALALPKLSKDTRRLEVTHAGQSVRRRRSLPLDMQTTECYIIGCNQGSCLGSFESTIISSVRFFCRM